jgi:hypothetical protein
MRSTNWAAAGLVALCAGVAGCSNPSNMVSPTAIAGGSTDVSLGADVNRRLAATRAAVAPYHNLDKAEADGFVEITGCVALPGVGGMGHHYAQLPFDATATELEPEVLVYAPENGKLKLAAVEYIIPQDLWLEAEPPSLFGQDFVKNDVLDIWALHVWLFRHNPLGVFEDWNPTVSCPD